MVAVKSSAHPHSALLVHILGPFAMIGTAFFECLIKDAGNEKPQLSQDTSRSNQAEQWMITGHEDIARVIERTIAPYIDRGNVALQHDELRDECWFKVAKLLTSSTIGRCETRQKFFGLVKVSLKNHVRSLVHKHAFTIKRTGSSVPPKGTTSGGPRARKTKYVRLDDADELFELAAETNAEQVSALSLDFANMLSSPDRLLLQKRLDSDEEIDPVALGELRRRFEEFLRA